MPLSQEQFRALRASGLSIEQIVALGDSAQPGTVASRVLASQLPPIAINPSSLPLARRSSAGVERLSRALPDLLGGAGGLVRGPLGYALAPTGGAIGEAGGQLLRGESLDPGAIARAAATQEAYQISGGLLGRGARAIGRPLMEQAVGAAKSIRRQFPKIAETIVRERIPVTRGIESAGPRATASLRRESAATTAGLIRQAQRSGVRINIEEISLPAIQAEESARGRVLSLSDRQAIVGQVQRRMEQLVGKERFLGEVRMGRIITPQRLQQAKRVAQITSKGARKARAEGRPVLDDPRLDDAIAKGSRRALEEHIEGLAASNARTQELIGLQRAMEEAAISPTKVNAPIFGPFRPVGAMSPSVGLSRPFASKIGLALTGRSGQAIARQTPRLLDLLYGQANFAPAEPDITEVLDENP